MDFSDGYRNVNSLPYDEKYTALPEGPAHLSRNKTERRRLQGLLRTDSLTSTTVTATNPKLLQLRERWTHWMVNDGGRTLFLSVWGFLHALVFALGFLNYYFKDNLTVARATFGLGYREQLCLLRAPPLILLFLSNRSYGRPRSSC